MAKKSREEQIEQVEIFIENFDYFRDFLNYEDGNIDLGFKKYGFKAEDLENKDFKAKLRESIINEILKDEEE